MKENSYTDCNNRTVHILLVEDDDVDASGLRRALKNAKIINPVHRARDGIEALNMLKGREGVELVSEPYLLLVDLNMPRMGGIELITEIRNDEELKSSVVFVLTTSKHDEDMAAAYNLNIAGYILKENAGDDFIRLIDLLDSYWRIVEMPQ
ncbi:MAG: response regulator [Rickettsiales bacterium]